jgi:hypothetical protein
LVGRRSWPFSTLLQRPIRQGLAQLCRKFDPSPAASLLHRYQGHVSAALVLGGVDFRGPHLFTVYPHGSTDALPYATMGSGSLNAMAVFEDEYKCGLRPRL